MYRLFSELFGPIFAKEMIEMSRRRRYFVNRVLYTAALLLVLFVVYQENHWRILHTPGIQMMARLARELFDGVCIQQYVAVYLFVPVFVCAVIAGEREANTLELLFTTSLDDHQIVLGKLASRLAVVTALILSALPVFGLIRLFGGIDFGCLVRVEAATILAMVYTGAHAMYFSVHSRSPIGALVRTYWWMGLWLLVLPVVLALVLELLDGDDDWVIYLVYVNPTFLLPPAVFPDAYPYWRARGRDEFLCRQFRDPGALVGSSVASGDCSASWRIILQ